MKKEEYMKQIDSVIENGEYKPDWESLCRYGLPEWYSGSKLGIFLHWGVYSVPAFYNEWYPRLMHYKFTPVYRHHIATYGEHFTYRDFIEKFTADKFDAADWVSKFKKMGADFIMPVGEHHDGFKMYDSDLSPFNSKLMGPHRDILGEIRDECIKQGVRFATSSHRAERWWYYNGARLTSSENEIKSGEYFDLYGPANLPAKKGSALKIFACSEYQTPSESWLEDWLVNSCELIDKYRPSTIFFDWWVSNKAFRPYIMKFLAYYYNRSVEWGEKVCVQSKFDSIAFGQGIFDRERGQLNAPPHFVWQSETATSYSSWGYTSDSKFKSAAQIACNYVDVVAKGGVFVLNFGPKSDGTLCKEEEDIVAEMIKFNDLYGDILSSARPFRNSVEGKQNRGASFVENIRYTSRDKRYMYKAGKLYCFIMAQNKKGVYKLFNLADIREKFNGIMGKISVAGYPEAQVFAEQKKQYLQVRIPSRIPTDMPFCLKIEVM